jgi:sugar/nucleoside kinase (ribokinase family)
VTPRIVVVGDALLDVGVLPDAPMVQGADVPAAIRLGTGGQGANVAVRLARQGADVTLVCAVADDAAGTLVREALGDEGVALVRLPAISTGTVVILGGADGERTMLSQRAPIPGLTAPPEAAWLVVSGYPFLQDDADELARRLASWPMRRVLLGCAVPDAAASRWRAAARALRPDLVVANRHEADRLLEADAIAAVAVTDATGAEVSVGPHRVRADAPAAPPAVDTTGAGDAFAAGLVAALAGGPWPPSEAGLRGAATRAVALAAAVARVPGAQAPVDGERPATLRP